MRIIQSFWTAQCKGLLSEFKCGWENAELHYLSWVMSTHKAIESNKNLELYADRRGRQVLEYLDLPFTKIHESLNDININGELWAFGKIHTYSIQTEPFYHIDSDVFLFKVIPDYKILVQSVEHEGIADMHYWYYYPMAAMNQLLDLPPELKVPIQESYNFGIFGGTDLENILRYANKVKGIVEQNKAFFEGNPNTKIYMPSVEQGWGYLLLKNSGITTLFRNDPNENEAVRIGYTHIQSEKMRMMSGAKLGEKLIRRVQNEYPKSYELVQKLLMDKNI